MFEAVNISIIKALSHIFTLFIKGNLFGNWRRLHKAAGLDSFAKDSKHVQNVFAQILAIDSKDIQK